MTTLMCGTRPSQTTQIYNHVLDEPDVTDDRRVALKIAYDGSEFHGFQRQPQTPTVEGSLVDALEAVGATRKDGGCGLRSSSRTDRGVSALGNVVSFKTGFHLGSLCRAVNSEMASVWAYSAVEVADDFNPRWARQRWYRYFLPLGSHDIGSLKEAAGEFVGTHDFSGFARLDNRNPMRTIESIDVIREGRFVVLDFKAESFLWNMVRRIVWLLDAVGEGRIGRDEYDIDKGIRPRRIGLAPPEYLLLMDVDCGIEFPYDPKAARAMSHEFGQRLLTLDMEREFAGLMRERLGGVFPSED